jgi:hypothetical protein
MEGVGFLRGPALQGAAESGEPGGARGRGRGFYLCVDVACATYLEQRLAVDWHCAPAFLGGLRGLIQLDPLVDGGHLREGRGVSD